MPELQSPVQLSIDEILASFAVFDGKYKHAEVDAAISQRENIVPRLIEILEDVLTNPEKVAKDEIYFAHTYALMLLGHFRESKAHRTIIALCSLPRDLPYLLFGETITEDMAVILLRTCNGSLEAIKELVQNKSADDYCRGAAARAITYGVVEGIVPREEALSFLGGLFREEAADVSGAFYDIIASCIYDLYPGELMEEIEALYVKGIIHPFYIGIDDFRRAVSKGKEKCLLDLKAELRDKSLDDIHKRMSWWACFHEKPQPIPLRSIERRVSNDKSKKARRKIAKASRKKNRRRKR